MNRLIATAFAATLLLAGCGGSDRAQPAATAPAGSATNNAVTTADGAPQQRALAVTGGTTSLAVPVTEPADPLLQGLTIPADAPQRGMWSASQPWPMNAIHLIMLSDGRVLSFGTPKGAPDAQDGRTDDLWTPSLGFAAASHQTVFNAAYVNSFCGAAAWLADGRLLLSGGNSPLASGAFSPSSGLRVTEAAALTDQRWYSTMLTLPDGRLVMLGGMDPYQEGMINNPEAAIANGTVSMTPEIFTPGTGWRSLSGARSREAFGPDHLRASYPRAWVAPNGLVVGISAEKLWSLNVNANGGAGAVTVLGNFKGAPNAAAPVNVGATSSAVMFAPGKVLQVGGNGGFNGDGLPASNAATVVDFNGGTPLVTDTTPMAFARRYANTVVLPNGQVLVTGGTRVGNNGGADAVYAAELWNPATGRWTTGASAREIRVYHSTTLLLPNGTVLSAGGGAPGPVSNLNAEVYYPPYLFRSVGGVAQLAPRPRMVGLSTRSLAPAQTFQVQMADAAAMSRVVLVANGSGTHSFNSGQRFVELGFQQAGDLLTVQLPPNTNLTPPGHYQLAVIGPDGVPSVATIVGLGLSVKSPAETPALAVGSTTALTTVNPADQAVATDAAGFAITVPLASSAAAPAAAQYKVTAGLADAACRSFESVASPGRYLRHAGFRLQLGSNDGSALFLNDATFCPEPGLAGSGLGLRSKNYPGHLVRARNGELWIDPQASDAAFAGSASFLPRSVAAGGTAGPTPLPSLTPLPAAPVASGSTVQFSPGLDAPGLSFSWDFGDGTVTGFGANSAASHTYAQPGLYTVTLTVRSTDGRTATQVFVQAVYGARSAQAARSSTPILLEPRSGASARLWVVNADNDSVTVFDTANGARLKEIATGAGPRSIALAADGRLWVSNRDAASLSVIDPATLAVAATVALPAASRPWGLVVGADGTAWVALGAYGELMKLDSRSRAVLGRLAVGPNPRHLAVTADSATVLVPRFISPVVPGESTGAVNTAAAAGEVLLVDAARLVVRGTTRLAYSSRTDTETSGSGLPNYLGAPAIAPDGVAAWVPSKQDNIGRGQLRNRQPLDFQNTVRAISSRLLLASGTEDAALRVDHDNASLASAAVFDPTGSYLFVALETSREVAVLDARRGTQLLRVEVGLAPQGLAVSADGLKLYAHNFMGRSVSVVDLGALMKNGVLRATASATWASVATDKLPAAVLRGKQLFYDARDPRLARDAYMSCASCHSDAGHDGRTWDFTQFGEGLRNTPALKGRAGMAQGFVHWSANFDEIQDFEGQIRNFAGGTGLMSDAQFNTGTRRQPLGDRKAGVSADLDALAAYLGSLNRMDPSPFRAPDGTLTAAAAAGRTVFTNAGCATCHGGTGFTASGDATALKTVGTVKPASGQRLGAALTGLDVPTLRDVWATAPYLHDGSAPTLAAAVQAHAGTTVAGTDLANLVAYLQQIGSQEASAPGASTGPGPTPSPPTNAVACGVENASCALPAGATATVWYGANASWAVKTGVTGSIACNNATFGDPLFGTVKACRYLVTSTTPAPAPTPVNLAPTAALATSYVSPWERLAAVNNNITPTSSADKNGGAYGNWQGTAVFGRTDWVSFTWPAARTVSAFEVYWWNDGLGIATPTYALLEYWNGSAWVALGAPGLALNGFNRLAFTPVVTTRLRLSMRSTRATGILEARAWGN